VEVSSQYSNSTKIFTITPNNLIPFVHVAYTWNGSYYHYSVERSELKNLFLYKRPGASPIMVFKNWYDYDQYRQQIENQGQDDQKPLLCEIISVAVCFILFCMLIMMSLIIRS
jgi:hypothetical protein